MLKRTLYFSNPASLSLKNNQMVISSSGEEVSTVPVEDIGFVIIENMQVVITMKLMEQLMINNSSVVFCNGSHYPASMLLNLEGNCMQTKIFKSQIEAKEPLKKNLWKQIIEAKVRNQAGLLKKNGKEHNDLVNLIRKIKSGDTSNIEGTAARIYWKRLFGKFFKRERFGMPPNDSLNYGYAILRAAVARSLTGSGLLPTLGIKHHNCYNAFCLADDIMEPYRPYVDDCVYEIMESSGNYVELDKEIKSRILEILASDVKFKSVCRPLMVGLSMTTASVASCLSGVKKKLVYPVIG